MFSKIFFHAIFFKQLNFKVLFQSYVTFKECFVHPVLSNYLNYRNSQKFPVFVYQKIVEVCQILMCHCSYLRLISHLTYLDIGIRLHMHLIKLDYIVFSLPALSPFQISVNS